jgi:competence protein ComEC
MYLIMQQSVNIPFWKTSPFVRLLVPIIIGIVLQWYLQCPLLIILIVLGFCLLGILSFHFLSFAKKYTLQYVQGFFINISIVLFAMLLLYNKDMRHNANHYLNFYASDSSVLVVKINEPLIAKTKSYKADATVMAVIKNGNSKNCTGKLLLYFSKDSLANTLQYDDVILINKKLQTIKNSGNPGAFNYQRYAAFQQIFYNTFLKSSDWQKTNLNQSNKFYSFIYQARNYVINILQQYIGTKKDELGIAEALLIGYTNDLDKDLVQAYSNTGVVHIIAISGMHLGLLYVLLVWLLARLPFVKKYKLLQIIVVLSFLWMFSLITGAAASVIRSAVMFTCIAIGKNFFTKASIYNSLATSAFLMLCYNPYYLWDVGFQLSYSAVIGIVVFQKPIYHLLYVKNKLVDKIWEMVAITLAAQLLTFPICVYYFHQFPLLFLFTNLVAVPLSTIILFLLIALIIISGIPIVNVYLGKIIEWLLSMMNSFIGWVNTLSFSLWDKIPATFTTTCFLYITVIGICSWLLSKNKLAIKIGLLSLFIFIAIHAYLNWQIKNQQKIIVYNVPQHQAIDFVMGNQYQFIGDSILLQDGLLQNFHLKPGRISLQLTNRVDSLNQLFQQNSFFQFLRKKILLINKAIAIEKPISKIDIDLIVISKNAKVQIADLYNTFNCKQIVFDASNSLWKITQWKKQCEELHLQCYSVSDEGAYIFDL